MPDLGTAATTNTTLTGTNVEGELLNGLNTRLVSVSVTNGLHTTLDTPIESPHIFMVYRPTMDLWGDHHLIFR